MKRKEQCKSVYMQLICNRHKYFKLTVYTVLYIVYTELVCTLLEARIDPRIQYPLFFNMLYTECLRQPLPVLFIMNKDILKGSSLWIHRILWNILYLYILPNYCFFNPYSERRVSN
jgi:hypothetical protein